MQSDEVRNIGGAEQGQESATSSATEAASPRRTGAISLASTCQSSSAAGWCLADVQQQQLARLHPATSAVHLVPDIVVEHVSSSTFSDTGTSRQPLPCHGLCLSPISPDVVDTRVSTGRQFRALSDSSVYQLERHQDSSSVAVLPDARRRATCPVHSSGSADQFSVAGVVKFSGDDSGPPELEMEVFSSECTSQDTSGSAQRLEQPLPVSVVWPDGSPYWQPPLPSMQSLGPERSPKANWLRRHSDSNLTSGHSCQTGLRVEPYPIRSRSTGDTFLSVVSSRELPVLCAADGSFHRVSTELTPACRHVEHPAAPSHLWSTAGRLWRERASPAARKFFSEGSERSARHAEVWQLSGRSRSENVPSRVLLSQSEKTCSTYVSGTDESPLASAAMSPEQTEVVDMSTHERVGAVTERSEGLVKKRMKLKKYLQTRYQMSQHRLRQSSDTDDVFTERASTPDRSASSAAEVSAPEDLSTRSQFIPAAESVSVESETTSELHRGNSRHFSISAGIQEPSDSRTFHTPCGHSQFPLSADDPHLVKREPTSPGIVPSGTSVFVFPPALPSHHESTQWYQPVRYQPSSPVTSPMASAISESYHPVHFPRFFRQPSFSGEETPFRATGLRMGHQHATDVSAVCRRRACSLAISTEISPLTLSKALPSTPQHRRTVAGPELMSSVSLPVARLSLAESFPHRLQSGSQWRHHHYRGRRSSSSVEDPANFTCPLCSVVFPSYRHLTDHMVDHVSGSPPPPPVEPGEHSEAEVASSEATGGPKAVHLCPICQRSFSRGDMLTRHVRLHTGIRPYECTLCSQVGNNL